MAEDFELLQLYGSAFQLGEALGKAVKASRAKKGSEEVLSNVKYASDVVMVAASALAAQVYPDSRYVGRHFHVASIVLAGQRRECAYLNFIDFVVVYVSVLLSCFIFISFSILFFALYLLIEACPGQGQVSG